MNRKDYPLATGLFDYFPDALKEVARLSKIGNDQHNPGQPMHWAREKSNDHDDCLLRHFMDRGRVDTDDVLHRTKVVWRALAALQLEIEQRARVATAMCSAVSEDALAKEFRGAFETKVTPPPTFTAPPMTATEVQQRADEAEYRRRRTSPWRPPE